MAGNVLVGALSNAFSDINDLFSYCRQTRADLENQSERLHLMLSFRLTELTVPAVQRRAAEPRGSLSAIDGAWFWAYYCG